MEVIIYNSRFNKIWEGDMDVLPSRGDFLTVKADPPPMERMFPTKVAGKTWDFSGDVPVCSIWLGRGS